LLFNSKVQVEFRPFIEKKEKNSSSFAVVEGSKKEYLI
jgi:hypothetical protein